MFSQTWIGEVQKLRSTRDRRSSGRVCVDGLWTDLGPVIDISRGGIRVLSKSKRSGMLRLRIYCGKGPIEVGGRVRRCRRRGFRKYELGVEFINVTPKLQHALTAMARTFGEGLAA